MFRRRETPETRVVAEFLRDYTVPVDLISDAHGPERLYRVEAWMRNRASLLPGLELERVNWRLLVKRTLARS